MTQIRQIKTDNKKSIQICKTRKIGDLSNYVKIILKKIE
jgi:hypothetical protein